MTHELGSTRYAQNRARGTRDFYRGPSDRKLINDEMSAKAEYFVEWRYGHEGEAERRNAYRCDMLASRRYGKQKRPSCIGIKWTRYERGALSVPDTPKTRDHRCVAYILVVGDTPDEFRIVGWAYRQYLKYVERGAHRATQGGAAWLIEQDDPNFRENYDILVAALLRWTVRRTTKPREYPKV